MFNAMDFKVDLVNQAAYITEIFLVD